MATVARVSFAKLCFVALTGYCSAIPQKPASSNRHREFSVHKHGSVNSGIFNFVEDMPGSMPSGREEREFSTVANGLMRRERLVASKAQAAAAATAAKRKHSALVDGAKATKAKGLPPVYLTTTVAADTPNEGAVTEEGIPENNETLGSNDAADETEAPTEAATTVAPPETAAATETPTKEAPGDKDEKVEENVDPESDATDDGADMKLKVGKSTEEAPGDKDEQVEENVDPESDATDDGADTAAATTVAADVTTAASSEATTGAAGVTSGNISATGDQSEAPLTTKMPQLAEGQCAPASAYVGGGDIPVSCLEGQAVGDGHWCTPKCGCGNQAVIFMKGKAPPEGGDGPEWGSKLFCKAGVLYPLGGFSCIPDVFNTIDRNDDGTLSRSEFEHFQARGGNRTKLDVAEDKAVEILKDAELEAQSIKLSPRASAKDPDALVMVYITATVILFSIAALVLCYLLHQKMMQLAKAADAEGQAVAAKALLQETNEAVAVIQGNDAGSD